MSDVKTYAVISSETNIVENVILWDGESEWQPPAGTYVEPLNGEAGISWKFENGEFTDARQPCLVTEPVPEPVPVQQTE
jgi:hypothetical protein